MAGGAPEDSPGMPPGRVRRDAEPHRGPLLLRLAEASLACGALSLILVILSWSAAAELHEVLCYFIPLPAPFAGLVLAVVAEVMARRDLALMPSGLVDERGAAESSEAQRLARYGLVLNLVWVLLLLGWPLLGLLRL